MLFKKRKFLVFFFIICSLNLDNLNYVKAYESIEKSEVSSNSINENFYLLGPGDQLSIKFVGAPALTNNYLILSDGNIQLPIIGATNLSGLSLNDAEKKLVELYQNELIRPEVYINVLKSKPLRVSIIGEIIRPGSYTLDLSEFNRVEGSSSSTSIRGYPTVVDAIQKAGGLTLDADITNISLSRMLPGEGKGFKKTELNLLDMIQNGNQINNPILFDKDVIKIKQVSNNNNMLENIPNNLTPEEITLHVIGEVASPGKYRVPANTQISQAILMAGGPRSWRHKDKVHLLRVRRNGTIKVSKISFNKEGVPTRKSRISLRNGDIVKVNKNLFGKSTDALATFLPPIRDMYSLYGVYKLIED